MLSGRKGNVRGPPADPLLERPAEVYSLDRRRDLRDQGGPHSGPPARRRAKLGAFFSWRKR
jgi:hypothetical protein